MGKHLPGYPFLAVSRPDVNWRGVSPILLRQLNAMGREIGKVITIFSGYRSDAYSAAHGGFAGDPHTQHIAVDATINGKPIGSVVSKQMFYRFGIRTGNVPGFYKGKPDPSHVDLIGTSNEKPAREALGTAAPSAPPSQAPAGPAEGAAALPDYTQVTSVGAPQAQGPPVFDPGTVPADGFTPKYAQQLWQTVASQPFASQETQWYASQLGAGGQQQGN